MNKKTIFTILAILIVPVLIFCGLSAQKDSGTIANAASIPQVIKFSSTMCLECKQIAGIFDEMMPQYQGKVDYKQVIVDSRKDMKNPLIKQYKVNLVPTVVMVNSDGTVAKKIVGAVSKEKYEECIKGLK